MGFAKLSGVVILFLSIISIPFITDYTDNGKLKADYQLSGFVTKDLDSIVYDNLTYRDVFEAGNSILNPSFVDPSNYSLANATIENGYLTYNSAIGMYARQTQIHDSGDILYYNMLSKKDNTTGGSNVILISISNNSVSNNLLIYNDIDVYTWQSGIITLTATSDRLNISRIGGNSNVFIDQHLLINLTYLGIDDLTQQQMDTYFSEYELIVNNGGTYDFPFTQDSYQVFDNFRTAAPEVNPLGFIQQFTEFAGIAVDYFETFMTFIRLDLPSILGTDKDINDYGINGWWFRNTDFIEED